MTPQNLKKRLYNKEYAYELFNIASGDLDSAIALSKANSGRPENIIFLDQQSIEKYIKAVLSIETVVKLLYHLTYTR